MCGLVGAVGCVDNKAERVFKDLLYIDVIRGPHSTGILNIFPSGGNRIAKGAMDPYELMNTKVGMEALSFQSSGLLGHNRYATVGAIDAAGSHPFRHGKIVGMHNGTLRGWQHDLHESENFDVDSDCLVYNIAERGIEEVIKSISGAYALVWHDSETNTLNMIRNSERPLSYCYSEDNRTLYFASEDWMIGAAAGRNGAKLNMQSMVSLEVNCLYSWDMPNKVFKSIGDMTKTKLKTRADTFNFKPYQRQQNKDKGVAVYARDKGLLAEREDIVKEFNKMRDNDVEFYIDSEDVGFIGGRQVLYGYLSSYPSYDVRVYCTVEQGEGLLDMSEYDLKGRVTGFMMPYIIDPYTKKERLDPGALFIDPGSVCMAETDEEEEEGSNVIRLREVIQKGPDGKPISIKDFDKITDKGCAICQANVWHAQGDTGWTNDNQPLCGSCLEELEEESSISVAH